MSTFGLFGKPADAAEPTGAPVTESPAESPVESPVEAASETPSEPPSEAETAKDAGAAEEPSSAIPAESPAAETADRASPPPPEPDPAPDPEGAGAADAAEEPADASLPDPEPEAPPAEARAPETAGSAASPAPAEPDADAPGAPNPSPEADGPPAPEPPPKAAAAARSGEYEVLALRYRPQTFADLVGQEPIARTLRNAIRRERISHAFLFSGQRGIGKTTTARILAKALNCSATPGPNPDPCGECPSCREVAGGFSRDVPEIDGASNNSVHKAREIIEAAHYTPVRDRFKIYLVDEVHMLSIEAFNALLKTLEEPPKHVKFIFATTEIHKIPDTILSRCQEFEFRAVTPQRVEERLRFIVEEQGFSVSDEALAQIARFGQGSMRDAISALDQVLAAVEGEVSAAEVSELLGVPDASICRRAAAAILDGDRKAVFEVVAELVAGGRDLKHFVNLFMHYLRDVVVCRAAPDHPGLLEWPDERGALTAFAEKFSEEDLLRSLDVLTRAQEGLRWSPEPRFHLEMALLKLVEMPRLAAFEDLLSRIEGPPGGAPAASPASAAGASGAPSLKGAGKSAGNGAPSAPAGPASASRDAHPGGAARRSRVPAASNGRRPPAPGSGTAGARASEPPRPGTPAPDAGAPSAGAPDTGSVAPEVWQDYLETFGGQIVEVRPFTETPPGGAAPPTA